MWLNYKSLFYVFASDLVKRLISKEPIWSVDCKWSHSTVSFSFYYLHLSLHSHSLSRSNQKVLIWYICTLTSTHTHSLMHGSMLCRMSPGCMCVMENRKKVIALLMNPLWFSSLPSPSHVWHMQCNDSKPETVPVHLHFQSNRTN